MTHCATLNTQDLSNSLSQTTQFIYNFRVYSAVKKRIVIANRWFYGHDHVNLISIPLETKFQTVAENSYSKRGFSTAQCPCATYLRDIVSEMSKSSVLNPWWKLSILILSRFDPELVSSFRHALLNKEFPVNFVHKQHVQRMTAFHIGLDLADGQWKLQICK